MKTVKELLETGTKEEISQAIAFLRFRLGEIKNEDLERFRDEYVHYAEDGNEQGDV